MGRRDPIFLLAAALLHATAFLGLRGAAPPWLDRSPKSLTADTREPSATAAVDDAGVLEVTLELDRRRDERTARHGEPAIDLRPAARAASTPSRAPSRAIEGEREHEAREAREARSEERAASPEPAPSSKGLADKQEELAKEPPSADFLPGLGAAPIWVLPGVLPQAGALRPKPTAPPPSLADQGIAPDADQSKEARAPFFPAAGTLASALADAVSASSTPPDADCTFELILSPQGKVISVRFLSASVGERPAWERIARAVQQKFAGQTLPLPRKFASGSKVYIAVSSRDTLPAGKRNQVEPEVVFKGAPTDVPPIESPWDDRFGSSVRTQGPTPKGPTTLGGKLLDNLGLTLRFKFDLSNVGAHRRRIVRSTFSAVTLADAADPAPGEAPR